MKCSVWFLSGLMLLAFISSCDSRGTRQASSEREILIPLGSDQLLSPFTDIKTSFKDGLVGVVTNKFSIADLKVAANNPEEFGVMVEGVHPAVKTALEGVKEDDNPILIFYYLK